MRIIKFTAFVAASVDGRISLDPKKSPDWTSREDWKFFHTALSKFEAVVVGRNTFEAARKSLEKRMTYVLSSREATRRQEGSVTFVNPLHVNLKKVFGKYKAVAVLGGGRVYQTMLDKGLMDEIYVTVEPLIFGRGVPMFAGGTKSARLRLISARRLNRAGTLLLHYKVKK
jgi:dihydrofolate reductase